MDQRKMTFNFSFVDDPPSRKVMRFLLLLEIAAMTVVVALSVRRVFWLALIISFLTLLLFILTLLWLHDRYRQFPVIREKKELERLSLKFQKRVRMEEEIIERANRWREELLKSEKEENDTALRALQARHIQNGLMNASIREASIKGIEPELETLLAKYNIWSAADLTERVSEVPDITEVQRQALIDWRSSVQKNLENSKPGILPENRSEAIQKKYRALLEENKTAHRNALASKQMLEYELISFQERLKQLALFTFPSYVSRSLASHGMASTPLVLVLVLTQMVSSVSAAASTALAMFVSIPNVTFQTPTVSAPAVSSMTLTSTATAASTATLTFTPSPTPTFIASAAPALLPISTPQLSDTPIIPVSGAQSTDNCDPAYPGLCIPPPPPDLDCKDVPYRRFQVLPPDPHGFDRDGDGVGCES